MEESITRRSKEGQLSESLKDSFKDFIAGTVLVIAFVGMPFCLYWNYKVDRGRHEKTYTEFVNAADVNHDGQLSQEELANAYYKLGLSNNVNVPMLSEYQMRRYVELNK
ncbi:hypothetical protein HYW74_05135 [Candidatus Pacearchaeota archaeon]|nr:hypothetical protein [Candidatus Pacearchaeota archaeon]